MAFDVVSYALSKKFTEDTAEQFGAVKGAPCKIKSIVHQNGRNTITFEWKNDEGETRESICVVQDGTPIYEWQSGDTYQYGDLVIYSSSFYRCTTSNSDVVFNPAKWQEIGSADGNYDIVETPEQLPVIFTAADRKMYYCISEDIFYLWNGMEWEQRQQPKLQFNSLPTASATFEGKIFQYTGVTAGGYTRGYWYICEETGVETGIYHWVGINVQDHVTVDSALSSVSENPVQNKVITHVISRLNTDISQEISARQRIDEQIQLAISALITDVDAAQTKTLVTPIVIDGTTTTTVEGALGALNNKTVDVDDALSNVSENPVQNKVVKGALDGKQVDVGLSIVNGKICVTYDVEVTENGQTVTQTVVRPILLDTTGANIVTSLNAIATALQGGDISATSSLPTASIDYVDSIKLLIGTQSGYETGGIYQCTESGGIYSWTLLNGSGGGGGTGGHTIEDGTGTDMTARTNLQFVGASVTDDSSNNRTVVSVADKADKVQSATENNLAKFDSTGNLADSGVADTSLVHKTGNETIGGTKTFTDEIISKSVGISPLNLVSGSSSTETWLKYTKGTDNSTLGLIGVKSDNKPYFYDSSAKRIALMEEVDAITNVATVESTTTASKPYTTGERLVLGGVLYKVTAAIASGGTIVTSGTGQNVDATTVDAEINGKADLTVLAPAFDASETYKRGQYVTYNGKLYRESTIDGHSGAWDADDFEETKVKDIRITGGKNPLSNIPLGFVATAEGDLNEASGDCSHAQGQDCSAEGNYSHAAGLGTKATKKCQTVIGRYNDNEIFTSKGADGNYAFQIGNGTSDASRSNAFSVKWNGDTSINGALTVSNGVKGYVTAGQRTGSTLGSYATAEGFDTRATNSGTHAEGAGTLASGESSHAEGSGTQATNYHAHAEGRDTIASGIDSHVEGRDGIALGICSHAEGMTTRANGDYSHAEGRETISDGIYSHAGGIGTIAQRKSQTTIGEYNVADTTGADGTVRGEYAFIVGNGTATNARSNAMTVSWSGDISDGHGNVLNEMFWKGTSSEWTALPAATKAKYAGKPVYLTDDAGVYTGMPQPYKFTLTGTGSVVTTTFSHASVTADMRVIDSTISNPSAVLSDMTITPANGSLTVSATVNGTTEVLLIMQPCRSEITLT